MSLISSNLEKNRFNQLMHNHFSWLLQSIPIAHTFTDAQEARRTMGYLLHYHTRMVCELCTCYACRVITAAYDSHCHPWRVCSNQFNCWLCYTLVTDTMHILLPEDWPAWAKRGL